MRLVEMCQNRRLVLQVVFSLQEMDALKGNVFNILDTRKKMHLQGLYKSGEPECTLCGQYS